MATVENGPVLDHVQAFADEGERLFGTRFTTYNGHSPDRTRALDCWDTDADMDGLVDFGRREYRRFGIDYIIWKQRIWNPEIRDDWRWMADRGDKTQNHYDHGHFSFEHTGQAVPATPAQPTPDVASLPMLAMGDRGKYVSLLQSRLVAHGHTLDVDGDFGPHTRARVQIHQSAWRLIPDGIVGPKTWPTLMIDLP